MPCFGNLARAFRQVNEDLDGLNKSLPKVRGHSVARKASTPEKFGVHRDAKFELRYPKEWDLEVGDGVTVRSKKIASFANVEVIAGTETPWKELEETLTKLGGTLEITKRLPGPPKHARGMLSLGPTRFAMDAWSWERGNELVVLITANVVDSERSRKIEQYEDKVLEAIRREFKVVE